MTAGRARSPGIPRLQEIEFLEVAVRRVAEGGTYDNVRLSLIEHMAAERERIAPSGNSAVYRLARHDPHRYMSNATEALAELMRLGFVEDSQLPTTRNVAPLYRNRQFRLTQKGEAWTAKLKTSSPDAYDELLRELWRLHPQFAGYLRLLVAGPFIVPTANWSEAHSDRSGPEGRETYIQFLAIRTANASRAGAIRWRATEEEVASQIRVYVTERVGAATRRHRPDPYPRSRDFVGACEEALVAFAFRESGLQIDYVSHEIIRRWTKKLAIANFSYHVPLAPALRIWSTAALVKGENGDLMDVRRRTVTEWGDRVIDELKAAYELARMRSPGESWVPIYQVRAAVCSKLGLGDRVFDLTLFQFLAGERRRDAPFRVNLDPAEYGSTPPTEQPFRMRDRSGRDQTYRVMSLVPRQ